MQEPVFDMSQLDEDTLGHLEYILNSPSWLKVMRPFLEKARNMYREILENPNPAFRQQFGGDEYLRSGANNIKKQLEFYDKIIAETNHERAIQARTTIGHEDIYLDAVRSGIIGPAGKTPDEYPADTEF